MIENYKKAYELTQIKFKKEDSSFPMIVLSLYGLLSKYQEYQDLVEKVFLETNIWIENKSVEMILKEKGIDSSNFYEEEKDYYLENTYVPAISSTSKYLERDKNNNIRLIEEKPFIICGDIDKNRKEIIINSFIHEFSHLIKAQINSYFIEEDEIEKSHYLRSGLHFYKYSFNKEKNIFEEGDYFTILDESINVLQTSDTLKLIKELDGIIPNEEISSYFNSLDKEKLIEEYGYLDIVKLLKPLWNIESFKSLIEENIIDGDLNNIVNNFSLLGTTHSFIDLSNALDTINDYQEFEREKDSYYYESINVINEIIKELEKKKRK
ncbi:MAG: hypothetical protein IKE70_03195 [Bacilli bacterium]|nr:hypothetical protein [Bacilli bacterium]